MIAKILTYTIINVKNLIPIACRAKINKKMAVQQKTVNDRSLDSLLGMVERNEINVEKSGMMTREIHKDKVSQIKVVWRNLT